jgi:large subunit ribosomal protein L17
MRHQVAGKHLSRTSAHRTALRRNLAASLFEHDTISTTREKARFVQPFVEKLISLAKDGSLHARRRAISLLQDRDICKIEDGEPVKVGTVIHKLFAEIGPRFQDRSGGYTRIIKLPLRRIGDNGQLVLLQLVSEPPAASAVKPAPRKISEESEPPEYIEEADTDDSAVPADDAEAREKEKDKLSENLDEGKSSSDNAKED